MSRQQPKKLSLKQRAVSISNVAAITFKASPLAVFIKFFGTLVTSVLPIITTYFAALTTTALADAYNGDEAAGGRAIMYVLITAGLGVLLTVWNSIEQYINQFVTYKIDVAISDRMYEQFLALDFWRYDDKNTADLFDKAKRFATFFSYVFDRIAGIFGALISMIAGLVALVLVSWWLGLILLIGIVPGVYFQFQLSRKQIEHWNTNVETRRAKDMIEWEMMKIDAIAELRLYGLVRHLLNLRRNLRDKDEKTRIEFERQFLGRQLGADVLEAVAEVVSLLYITLQIIAQAQPIGQFLYVQQVVSRALSGSRSFVSQLSRIDEDLANLFDYNEFMALPTAAHRTGKVSNVPQHISLQNVSFHYPGSEQTVVNNVTLSIKKGQHVALVGENGAGKSTLIKLLLGLYEPSSGTVVVDDTDLANIQLDSWHRLIGVLQQDFSQYSFATARDNVILGDVSAKHTTKRLNQALDRSEAREFLEKLPKGLDTFVNQWMEHNDGTSGVDLSGGQWQRLALARNFYRDSPIIVLDEPTSAIDALAESRIFNRLFNDTDKTVITISHRLTTIEKADVIFMLENGELVEQGTHDELVALEGRYYRMFKSQLRKA